MQYFSFLGMGNRETGYEKVCYTFDDSDEIAKTSKFVQEAVYERYTDEIDTIHIFCTKESLKRYKEDFSSKFQTINIVYIEIEYSIGFEDFVQKLLDNMRPKEDVIIGITHCFRSLPSKLLFALNYIEQAKDLKIQHLYYGKLIEEDEGGEIQDFIHDYHMQRISSLLSQFDKTLIISADEWKEYAFEDEKIKEFLKALVDFNQMVEFSEFDKSIHVMNEIINRSKSIKKEPDKYSLIIPLADKIHNKFQRIDEVIDQKKKKQIFIEELMKHDRYQVAITFTDQFFREELIRASIKIQQRKRVGMEHYLKEYKKTRPRKRCNEQSTFVYNFSQYLIFSKYSLRKGNQKSEWDFESFVEGSEQEIQNTKDIVSGYKSDIQTFYLKIRNHINHGSKISETKEEIKQNINSILECIEKI